MATSILLITYAGLLGLAVGSFLNVCTLRWPEEQSVVKPRSRCPGCGSGIAWYDNIPVLSWIILRGKCRNCGEPISIQYPAVELVTGFIWAGMVAVHGPEFEALRGALFLTILFGIAITDARFYIIPDEFSIGGTVLGLALAFAPGGIGWMDATIGAAVGYGVIWLVGEAVTAFLRARDPAGMADVGVVSALGGGDVKMMAMIGAFLGWTGVALTMFLGSVVAIVLLGVISDATKRLIPLGVFVAVAAGLSGTLLGWTSELLAICLVGVLGLLALAALRDSERRLIPFGIFLALGAAIAYGYGDAIIAWYRTSILGL